MVAVLSFTRAVQRLIEQTWELSPLSVRNTFNGLLWIGALALFLGLSGLIQGAVGRTRLDLAPALLATPLSVVFLVWTSQGSQRQAGRTPRRSSRSASSDALLLAAYSVGATVWVPHLFNTVFHPLRRDRRGLRDDLGALLRHGHPRRVGGGRPGNDDELDRIRRGERPAEDEVQRQWNEVTTQARSRWETLREQRKEHQLGRHGH